MSEKRNIFTLSLPTEHFRKVEMWTLASAMIILQVLDGFLTFFGVSTFGIEFEGNPLLRFLMEHWGAAFSLFVMKSLAIIAVIFMYFSEIKENLVKNGLWSLTAFYLICAIMPWSLILFGWSLTQAIAHIKELIFF